MPQPPSITAFRPAKLSRMFIEVMRLVNRFCAMPRARVSCEIRDVEKLRSRTSGVIITPNHSDYADAMVVTEVMRRARRFANFMATRENFDANLGLNGLVMQWMGGFSVNRGGENSKSQQFAKDVVKRAQYDLWSFPREKCICSTTWSCRSSPAWRCSRSTWPARIGRRDGRSIPSPSSPSRSSTAT